MHKLANELQRARGELKRLRTDFVKFKSEERHRMGKVEKIVENGRITLAEKEQIETQNYGCPGPAKKIKNSLDKRSTIDEIEMADKIRQSSLIADQVGYIISPFLTKCGTPHQPRVWKNYTYFLENNKNKFVDT